MKFLLSLIAFCFSLTLLAQNPDGFDKMATNMAGKKAPIVTMAEVQKSLDSKKNIIFLDSREENEYQTSHLPGAIWVGYDNIDWSKINKLDKNSTIVVYCSVGYRSGKLTEQLAKKGFKNVQNLYGGLFNWSNNGGTLQNDMKLSTKNVHGYNKNWSKWVNTDNLTVVL